MRQLSINTNPKSWLSLRNLFALILALSMSFAVFTVGQYIEKISLEQLRSEQRINVVHQLSAIRGKLEGAINGSMAILKGVASYVALNPDLTQRNFASFASTLIDEYPQIRNIGGAPDMVIRLMYPMAGNEEAVGLDYRKNPAQWAAAKRARDSGKMSLAGPVNLVQGGTGFIGRVPVYRSRGDHSFWGLVSGVINVPLVYSMAGLKAQDLDITVVIQGRNALGYAGDVFYGDFAELGANPVVLKINVPNGQWVLYGRPKNGWLTRHPDHQQHTIMFGSLVTLIMIICFIFISYRQSRSILMLRLRKLSQTVEQSPAIVMITDTNGLIEYVNPKFTETTGYAAEEVIGHNPRILSSGEKTPEEYAVLWETILSGGEWRGELHNKRKDGSLYWESALISPITTSDGEITNFMAIKEDITEQKRVQEKLKEGEAFFQAVFDNPNIGITILDWNGNPINPNQAFISMLGYSESNFPGLSYHDYVHPMDLAKNKQLSAEMQSGLRDNYTLIKRIIRKDGETTWMRSNVFRLTSNYAENWYAVSMNEDISDLVNAQDLLREALVKAEEASHAKSEFLATMSHELRTPLNAILGFSDMLRGQYFGPLGRKRYKEYAEDIHNSGDHLLSLISDILDISAIEAGKRELIKETIPMDELLQECISAVKQTGVKRGVRISLEPFNAPLSLYADKRAIKQIILNLLANAVKFSTTDDDVKISAQKMEQTVLITVADTGSGIDAELLPFITDPFARGHSNAHVSKEGSGLGLAIVKSLVDAHSGELSIVSEAGKGTTVTVSLPNAHS